MDRIQQVVNCLKTIDECSYNVVNQVGNNEKLNKKFTNNATLAFYDFFGFKEDATMDVTLVHRMTNYFSWLTSFQKKILEYGYSSNCNRIFKYDIKERSSVLELIKEFVNSFKLLAKCSRNEICEGLVKYFKSSSSGKGGGQIINLFKFIMEMVEIFIEMEINKNTSIGKIDAQNYLKEVVLNSELKGDKEKINIYKINVALVYIEECSTFIAKKIVGDPVNEKEFTTMASICLYASLKGQEIIPIIKQVGFYWKWMTRFYYLIEKQGLEGGKGIDISKYKADNQDEFELIVLKFMDCCKFLREQTKDDIENGVLTYLMLKFDEKYCLKKEEEIYYITFIINELLEDCGKVEKGMDDTTLSLGPEQKEKVDKLFSLINGKKNNSHQNEGKKTS